MTRGVVSGYELLTRFSGPPLAPPDQWFLAAATHGFSARLESVVVRIALLARERLPANAFLAVNVSPAALVSPEVAAAFAGHGSLDRLVIEITEQTQVVDHDVLATALAPLREAGAKVAVDDVGSAYAGLARVVAVHPDFLKLDRRFVTGVHRDEAKAAVIATLGDFASRIDAWVVAEGVERMEELDALARLRVPLSQGFLLARPQETMGSIDDALGSHMRARSFARLSQIGVGALAEPVPVVRDKDGREAIAQLFSAAAEVDYLPVVDARRRPVAVLSREGFFRCARVSAPLRVEQQSRVAEVARRAMTRPACQRFEPVVCCDELGRYVGIVRVERLVQELAL